MRDLKVALISEEFPPFVFGGISTFCYDLAYNLSKRSVATTVFCGRSSRMTTEQSNDYLKIVRLPCLDFPPRFLWFQLQNIHRILKLLRDFSVIHIVSNQAGALFAFFKKELEKPFVTSFHGTPLCDLKTFFESPFPYWSLGELGGNFGEYPLNELFARMCLSNSDQIVTCSNTALDEIRKNYAHSVRNKKLRVIYNGIDFDKIENTTSSISGRNFPSLICYGRLFWRKGFIYLVRAFAKVKQYYPDAVLSVFGKGPLEKKMKDEVVHLSLENNVHFKGFAPYSELLKEIRSSDVVALPSLYEAQPIAVLEAMAYRKTVVAFDFPFAREYICDGETGVLAKACDIQDLSDKIISVLKDKRLRYTIGNNAFDHVKRSHNWNVLIEKYIETYTDLI